MSAPTIQYVLGDLHPWLYRNSNSELMLTHRDFRNWTSEVTPAVGRPGDMLHVWSNDEASLQAVNFVRIGATTCDFSGGYNGNWERWVLDIVIPDTNSGPLVIANPDGVCEFQPLIYILDPTPVTDWLPGWRGGNSEQFPYPIQDGMSFVSGGANLWVQDAAYGYDVTQPGRPFTSIDGHPIENWSDLIAYGFPNPPTLYGPGWAPTIRYDAFGHQAGNYYKQLTIASVWSSWGIQGYVQRDSIGQVGIVMDLSYVAQDSTILPIAIPFMDSDQFDNYDAIEFDLSTPPVIDYDRTWQLTVQVTHSNLDIDDNYVSSGYNASTSKSPAVQAMWDRALTKTVRIYHVPLSDGDLTTDALSAFQETRNWNQMPIRIAQLETYDLVAEIALSDVLTLPSYNNSTVYTTTINVPGSWFQDQQAAGFVAVLSYVDDAEGIGIIDYSGAEETSSLYIYMNVFGNFKYHSYPYRYYSYRPVSDAVVSDPNLDAEAKWKRIAFQPSGGSI